MGNHKTSPRILRLKPGDFPVGSMSFRASLMAQRVVRAEEARALERAEFAELDPVQAATIEGVSNPDVRRYLLQFVRISRARDLAYELPCGLTIENIQHQRAIATEVDRLTGGKSVELQRSDPDEWRRLKTVAEENLRARAKSKSRGT